MLKILYTTLYICYYEIITEHKDILVPTNRSEQKIKQMDDLNAVLWTQLCEEIFKKTDFRLASLSKYSLRFRTN